MGLYISDNEHAIKIAEKLRSILNFTTELTLENQITINARGNFHDALKVNYSGYPKYANFVINRLVESTERENTLIVGYEYGNIPDFDDVFQSNGGTIAGRTHTHNNSINLVLVEVSNANDFGWRYYDNNGNDQVMQTCFILFHELVHSYLHLVRDELGYTPDESRIIEIVNGLRNQRVGAIERDVNNHEGGRFPRKSSSRNFICPPLNFITGLSNQMSKYASIFGLKINITGKRSKLKIPQRNNVPEVNEDPIIPG